MREKRLCNNCLQYGHVSGRCSRNKYCRQKDCTVAYKHHELLHPPPKIKSDVTVATTCHARMSQTRKVFLRAVPVTVRSLCGSAVDTYAMLDECSTTTLCSKILTQQLKSTGKQRRLMLTTINDTNYVDATDIELEVHALDKPGNSVALKHVLCVDRLPITSDIPIAKELTDYEHLRGIELPELKSKAISLLIGSDYPSSFIETSTRRHGADEELYAMQTKLGWSIVGPTRGIVDYKASVNFLNNELNDGQLIQRDMDKLWNTYFGDPYCDKTSMSLDEQKAVNMLRNSIRKDGKNYTASLPWREEPPALMNNRSMAESRLETLKKRLDKNETMKASYCEIMDEYEMKGYIRKVPTQTNNEHPIWYLPHHPVIHPKKKKVRIVYDAAAKFRGTCLNDHLLQGPDMANSLLGVLLRFRNHKVALAADIKEMLLHVNVNDRDSDAMRFLWWANGDTHKPPVDHQLRRHAFGLTSSPFVCNYVLQHGAEQNKQLFSEQTIETVMNNFYVDDCLKSVPNVEDANVLIYELTELLSLSGFTLHKWLCNVPEVMNNIPEQHRAPSAVNFPISGTDCELSERTLGIMWNVVTDTFIFPSVVNDKPYTKRGILSMTSSFYDPIGFFSPVILTAKVVLHDITRQNCSWDDPVSSDIRFKWLKWQYTLRNISDIKIGRCYTPVGFGVVKYKEIHYFCDASSSGYGAVSYMRIIDNSGRVHISFIMGKERLSPIKPVTILRLELSAATLAVKMNTTVMDELRHDNKIDNIVFWTDSTTVLHYIRNHDKRYKIFVANRLATIHAHSTVSQWRYVTTTENPADHASRGDDTTELNMWLTTGRLNRIRYL